MTCGSPTSGRSARQTCWGRGQVDLEIAFIAGYLSGKRVLVTVAGGSIGSELCRQTAQFDPAELLLVDRDESALDALQRPLWGRASLDEDEIVLLHIRDRERVFEVFGPAQLGASDAGGTPLGERAKPPATACSPVSLDLSGGG